MNIFKKTIFKGFNGVMDLLPFSLLLRIQRKKLLLPLYHTVSNNYIPHVIHVNKYCNVKQFEKDLDFFQAYFIPISLYDLLESLKGNVTLPDKSFLISFDDGHREVVEIITPILKKRSIPAVFFLNTSFIDNKDMSFRYKASLIIDKLETTKESEIIKELSTILQTREPTILNIKYSVLGVNYQDRYILDKAAKVLEIDFNKYLKEKQPYMTSKEIQCLIEQGFMIGSHSMDHPLFCNIPLEDQITQVIMSFEKLKMQFGINYRAFAFPFTDDEVPKEFYEQTHFNGIIDVSFGTLGFSKGKYVNNLQRQPMEGRAFNAEGIYKDLFKKEVIKPIKRHFV